MRNASRIQACVAEALLVERGIESIALRPHAYRTSHRLAELDVAYADGSSESLVLKDLGPRSLDYAARRVKPAFAHHPVREIDVYRTILAGAGLGTATFRGAVVDPSRRRYWLVVEKVEATELWKLESLDSWCRVAEWLAEMHRQLRDAASEHLVHWTAAYIETWLSRASRFSTDLAVRTVARRSTELTERLLALPTGFVHGELYASNVLVDERSGRVCPVDWELAGIGPLLLDLAALTAGAWTVEERTAIAAAYWRRSGSETSLEELLAGLDLCRLYVALQWLGWSPRWTPPPEHAHDWLTDVRVLAEEVGLT